MSNQNGKQPQALTLAQAAKILAIHPQTLRHWIHSGTIAAFRTGGGHFRILESEIERIISQRSK